MASSNWKLYQDVKGNTSTTVSILLPGKIFTSPAEDSLKERLDALVRVIVCAESFFTRVCTADAEPSGRKATVQAGFPAWEIDCASKYL